ncbi:DUF1428 domain-containing protein [Croceimicrobium sp.]|uniref:DUF1428 domain-containing protein n=1 Tax=Croceimicrobium sp. TaxID=2828340 RepID=UPI003BAD694A
MKSYIDAFLFPVAQKHLQEYQKVAEAVAEIWKEYGALAYFEFVGDDLSLPGTRSFVEAVGLKEDEQVVFGWALFPSKDIRDDANKKVPKDPRMSKLVGPLMQPERKIFDASRMLFGGFKFLTGLSDS